MMQPEIRKVPDLRIVYVERRGFDNGFSKAATGGFSAVMDYLAQNGLYPRVGACIGYMPDDMKTVAAADQRYVACFTITDHDPLPVSAEVREGLLPGGLYAVFLHKGSWDTLSDTWMEGWNNWFPTSGMTFRAGGYPLEIYLNDISNVAPQDLRTEVCLPVE